MDHPRRTWMTTTKWEKYEWWCERKYDEDSVRDFKGNNLLDFG